MKFKALYGRSHIHCPHSQMQVTTQSTVINVLVARYLNGLRSGKVELLPVLGALVYESPALP